MELLFIFFVIYMIFSAIARGLRAAAAHKDNPLSGQTPSSAPEQESARDLMMEENTLLSTNPVDLSYLEEQHYPDEYLKQKRSVHEETHVAKQIKPSSGEKQPLKAVLPRGARSQQREVSRTNTGKQRTKQAGRSKLDLDYLIQGKRLPLAIIAAEVISAPRGKKPFSQRNR